MKTQRLTYAPTRSRRLNEVLGAAVLVAAALFLLALCTYTPTDPSWNTVGGGAPHRPAHNWTGILGAYGSDLLLQVFGLACLALPLSLARVGVCWVRSKAVGSGKIKSLALALWMLFAPAGIAMLAPKILWAHALPIGGIEGRLLSDGLIHLINPPGAAIVCGLVVLLSLYLSTSFMLDTAQDWFRNHMRWAGTAGSRFSQWRELRKLPKADRAARRAEIAEAAEAAEAVAPSVAVTEPPIHNAPEEESWGQPAHAAGPAFNGAIDPTVVQPADALEEEAPRSSLLTSFLGFFGRRRREEEVPVVPQRHDEEPEEDNMWENLPRTRGGEDPATGIAMAAAAAAPFAAQLAAAATPVRAAIAGTDTGYEIGFSNPVSHPPAPDRWDEAEIPVRREPIAPREDDGWLDAPERQTFQPILNGQPPPNRPPAPFPSSQEAHVAAESWDEPVETPSPQLLVRGAQRVAPIVPITPLAPLPVDPPRPLQVVRPEPEPAYQEPAFPEPPYREPVYREPAYEAPANVPSAYVPQPVAARPAPLPPRAVTPPPQRPQPQPPQAPQRISPMADLRDQNISFGERADAHAIRNFQPVKAIQGYKLPPSSLLHQSEAQQRVDEDLLRDEARTLVEKFAEFGVAGRVEQINPGPVVTTFEFRPDAGVKVAKIMGLSDDLCLAMAAESVLIERMAGKSTVGIQVPNMDRETIWLRDVVENPAFAQTRSRLPIALGKDIDGNIVVTDLASMPHVLIAGSTGSGKSVAINAMIMSVLYRNTPEQVRMILVDPKRVELGMYEGIPHLFTPIITEAKLAANALKNAVKEMERRLKLLAANHVRNIDQFNQLFQTGSSYQFEDPNQEPLPYIIIVIDELADLMMLDRANVEEAITRLAQMARAVGIHLVLATQRPSVDVITGLLKANVPTRMSFRLATKVDSRTIIDTNGAESLLGRGDMLFLPPGTSRLQRVHAPFVTEKEISAVTDFWRSQGTAQYAEGFLDGPKEDKVQIGESSSDGENDPLFDDAVRLVFEFGKASTSLLQRRLRIGYGRAASLIDLMERDGLVGPADGSKPREILKPANYFAEADAALR